MTAWGLLSTARINRRILEGARNSDRVQVIAVASRESGRADAYAREHVIERAYGDYDALLHDPDVDAVYIPLPNSLHLEWTLRALGAGKHVLCEKPLSAPDGGRGGIRCRGAGGTRPLGGIHVEAPSADGSALEAGRRRRDRPAANDPRELQLPARGSARRGRRSLQPELDGGSLMDVGSYCVNAARFLAGEPERVYAEQVVGASGVDVCFAATLRFPGEIVAHFDCGFTLPYRDELEVIGDEASVFVDDPWHIHSPSIELRREPEPEKIEVERILTEAANSYQLELENVSDAIRGAAPLLLGREDAIGQARALDALRRSAETGVPVELEPSVTSPIPSSHWSDS